MLYYWPGEQALEIERADPGGGGGFVGADGEETEVDGGE